MLTKEEFRAMFKRDLKRAELNQKKLAHEFTMRGETISPTAITYWMDQGYIPGARLKMALDILGPDCELARVPMAVWHNMQKAERQRDKRSEDAPAKTSAGQAVGSLSNVVERLVASRKFIPNTVGEVLKHLPDDFKASFNPPMEDRDARHIPSYSRGGLVAQIVLMRPGIYSRSALVNAIFKLAVIKAVHGHEAIRSHVVLIIKAPVHPNVASSKQEEFQSEELRDHLIATYAYDAQALNVQTHVVEDAKEAAEFLRDWATRTILDPLDEDGVEEIDPDEDF